MALISKRTNLNESYLTIQYKYLDYQKNEIEIDLNNPAILETKVYYINITIINSHNDIVFDVDCIGENEVSMGDLNDIRNIKLSHQVSYESFSDKIQKEYNSKFYNLMSFEQ